ncbi:MAG: MscL family protein [Candidatus Saccharibacteria bacterium]
MATKKVVIKPSVAAIKGAGAKHGGGFVTFVREQGVVGLAVGLAVGTSAGAAVKSIVDNLINPIVGFLVGGVDLSKLTWVVVKAHKDGTGGLVFGWGAILSALITLVATAFVIYQLVHIAKLDRLDKKKS